LCFNLLYFKDNDLNPQEIMEDFPEDEELVEDQIGGGDRVSFNS
jgi:hypothetical protein